MTVAEAIEIVRSAARPGFHGDLTIRIVAGGVAAVDVKQVLKSEMDLKQFMEKKSA